ncbi:pitrilysin family protein [Sphingomonas sp. 67-36]|nr:pitrilysin family protein [Sphingomonas sp. 67-36]OJV31184.1 MAG: peptidase M16 [Sphingomonas sp. 67-36]
MRLILPLLLAATAVPALAEPAPPLPAVQPVAFTERTLANGLRVYAIRDAATPNVAIQVWYDVGGRDDPRGRSGFAHLFEHLMFKATRNLRPEQFDRLTEDVGGYNNASTGDDYTNYFEVVPANHLQRLLFAEADRMASLVVSPADFASERDVVKEEFRQSVLARPYGKLDSLYLPALAYQHHPYARGVIGSIANLDSATIDDVRAFHATYYRPDNAILVVAGNFDPAELDRWVDRYFAPIKRPDRPIPRVTADEPVRTKPVTVTVHEPNTPLPAIALSYPLPPDRAPDMPALMVLQAILARGESSRLHESLVYRDGLAQAVDASLDTRAGPGKLDIIAIAAGGKDPDALDRALRAQIAAVRAAPVTPAELAEAKTEILTDALKAMETTEGRARVIAASVLVDGDPRATERQLAAVRAVTAADVQRVARTWLADDRVATIRYLPAAEGAKPDAGIPVAATVETRPLEAPRDIAVVTPATDADRAPLPPLGPVVAGHVPTPGELRLANGLRVVTVERHDVPLVTARLIGASGAARDAAGKAGTAGLAATLLTKGTPTRSATQIARDAEALGASLDTGAGREGSAIGITVATPALSPALGILADAARHATLAPDELERARAQAIDAAQVTLTDPMALAGLVADRALYGTSGYGGAVEGTPTSLKRIIPADVRAAYAAAWSPDRATLILTGDITPVTAKALAERWFGDWRAAGPAPAPLAAPTPAATPRTILIDLPDAGQAGVTVARGAIPRGDPRYYPALLANTVLGGGYTSRLNQEIRIRRGLSYGARSDLDADRLTGSITAAASTRNDAAPEVVSLIAGEMRRLGSAPIAESELATRRSVLIGNFGRQIERTAGLAGIVGNMVLNGLPIDEMTRYADAVRDTPAAAVQSAAAALFDPADATTVVVGDARAFGDALRKERPATETIPAATLNLDSVNLR